MGMLDGRVAIVTGAGRGLGRAHALALAAAGASVVVNDLGAGLDGTAADLTPAATVVNEIEAAGGSAVIDAHSVSDWASAGLIVRQATETFGRLDIVVNNAGITRDRMIASSSEDDFDLTLGVHLKGTYAMCHHAATYWRSEKQSGRRVSGRIINTTSGTGMLGNAGQSAYGAAKAGIIGITLTLALELRRYGVTVNAISPFARTRMTESVFAKAGRAEAHDGMFDSLDPANASPVVVYLSSMHADWLSGQVLRVEGDRIIKMRGWVPTDEYESNDGGALSPEELVDAVPVLFGAIPGGVSSTKRA